LEPFTSFWETLSSLSSTLAYSVKPEYLAALTVLIVGSVIAKRASARWKIRKFPGNPVVVMAAGSVCNVLLAKLSIPRELMEYIKLAMIKLLLMPQSRGEIRSSEVKSEGAGSFSKRGYSLSPSKGQCSIKTFGPPYTVVVPVVDCIESYSAAKQQRWAEYELVKRGIDMVESRLKQYPKENVVGIEIVGAPNAIGKGRGYTSISSAITYYRSGYDNTFDKYLRAGILIIITDAVC